MKAIHWPFWAALGGGFAAWLLLGFTLPQTTNLNDVFDVAALGAFGAALLFVTVYTIAGLSGPAKWWRSNVGTYLVLAAVSVLFIVGPTAFAVLFHHGQIDTWWWAWAYVGGHLLAAVMWAALGVLWLCDRPGGNGQQEGGLSAAAERKG